MYYDHFGLTRAPFKITPNTEFFFTGGNRGPVLEALMYAITNGEGIVKVSGEVGSGKTMLCNMLQERLPDNVESVYLANPSVAPEDVLHAIAFELQLGVDRGADRLEVMHVLQDYLVNRYAEGKRVVVFIEESQSMPLATLEEIRLLSNLETRNDKLLQIILFGQPELDEILRRPDTRQLRDRIAHSFSLEPLTQQQVREYLTFRMRAAGYRGPEIFSAALVKKIAKASSGLTRRVNLIADKALLAAFSENTHTVSAKHIEAALRDSEFGKPVRRLQWPLRYAWLGLAVVVGTVLGASLYALADGRVKNAAPATAMARAAPPAAPIEAVRAPVSASIAEVGRAPARTSIVEAVSANEAPAAPALAVATSAGVQATVTPASMQTAAPATMTDAPLNEMSGNV
ncbi:MAG TPA: AAA family ATPase, partial [Burkholderiales bacterium]|nr:AAA family ATPase [Burkholderiales bacterium]